MVVFSKNGTTFPPVICILQCHRAILPLRSVVLLPSPGIWIGRNDHGIMHGKADLQLCLGVWESSLQQLHAVRKPKPHEVVTCRLSGSQVLLRPDFESSQSRRQTGE